MDAQAQESASSEAPKPSEKASRIALMCDCCGKEKLAEVVDGKLVVMDRRHGKRHIFSERLDSLTRAVLKPGEIRLVERTAVRASGGKA